MTDTSTPAPAPSPEILATPMFSAEQERGFATDGVNRGFFTEAQAAEYLTSKGVAPAAPNVAAKEWLTALHQGKMPEISKDIIDPSRPGHAAAKAMLAKNYEMRDAAGGAPPPAPATPGAQPAEQPAIDPATYDVSALKSTDVKVAVAMQDQARQIAADLRLDPNVVKGSIAMLSKAVAARGNEPMNAGELATLDKIMDQRWGDKHVENVKIVNAALAKADKSGWLRRSILAAGPQHAALVMESIFNSTKDTPR
jgi:hypothetical protein